MNRRQAENERNKTFFQYTSRYFTLWSRSPIRCLTWCSVMLDKKIKKKSISGKNMKKKSLVDWGHSDALMYGMNKKEKKKKKTIQCVNTIAFSPPSFPIPMTAEIRVAGRTWREGRGRLRLLLTLLYRVHLPTHSTPTTSRRS